MDQNNEEEFFDELMKLADTVIVLEEVTKEDEHRKECFETSIKWRDHLFEQIKEKMKKAESQYEKVFVLEATLNFLLFSVKKLIVYEEENFEAMEDKNIKIVADNFFKQIMSCTREEFNKKNQEKS
jgi:hypothetical protein